MMKKIFGVACTAALGLAVLSASPVVKMQSGFGVSLGGQALAADMAPPPPPVIAPVGKGKAPPPVVTKG
jgi:hypothetical protein